MRVVLFLLRRVALGLLVVLATAVLAYGGIRALRPDRYGGESWLSGTLHDLDQALLHLNPGGSCGSGCVSIHDMWLHGILIDVSLLGGALLLGAVAGTAGGRWCAVHRGGLRARTLEALAMLFYCAPPYVVALCALLVFDPFFGILPVTFLVDPNRFGEPFANVPDFLRGMLLPWLIASAPIAAACLRLTLAMTTEEAGEDYVRTALAKGLSRGTAIRRHAGRSARAPVISYIGAAASWIVLNVLLVEFVFALPGFLKRAWRAFGTTPGSSSFVDYDMLQAIAVWIAVLVVAVGIIADVALAASDPRVRARGRPG